MKKLSILALSTTAAITPDFTETDVNHHTPKTELSAQQADLSFAFDDVENLQATDMTLVEMQETQGAFSPIGVGLAIAGRFATNQLVKHYIGSAGIVYGTYSFGKAQSAKGK